MRVSEPTQDPTQDAPSDLTHEDDRDARVEERALLLPEERAVGSDDPEAQAAAILADSDLREEQPGRTQQDSPQSPDLSADD